MSGEGPWDGVFSGEALDVAYWYADYSSKPQRKALKLCTACATAEQGYISVGGVRGRRRRDKVPYSVTKGTHGVCFADISMVTDNAISLHTLSH